MLTRRRLFELGASAGAGLYLSNKLGFSRRVLAQVTGGTLSPGQIPKFVAPLLIPPVMPQVASNATTDFYAIAVRQLAQQILPSPYPQTTVWGYGSMSDSSTFNYPSYTIEARAERLVRVKWTNQLVDRKGHYLPHLLPVDQTLHWANPPGGVTGRDTRGLDATPYVGPVPIVTHVHGHHSSEESDGYPEAWYLPEATNIPSSFARVGTWYEPFRLKTKAVSNVDWEPGSATFTYENDQPATTLWYHDHTLGITRVNVYAGPAGFYLIRGGLGDLANGILPSPAPAAGDPAGMSYYEIPIVIQDRSFNANGSLFYPDNRAFFEGLTTGQLQIPFMPQNGCTDPSDVSPIWNPEFFGNTMVVNGRTWPFLTVEQRRYRFRLLNGCNSRFLILKMSRDDVPFWQVGGDGGFLSAPVELNQLLLGPAERADVIVDFTTVPVGTEIVLLNIGPDEPFGGGVPDVDFPASDPSTTGQVMQFRIVASPARDLSTPPAALGLPQVPRLPHAEVTRNLSINEAESETVLVDVGRGRGRRTHQPALLRLACDSSTAVPFGPTHAMLGLVTAAGAGHPLPWMHAVTDNPALGDAEIWAIHNFTADAHPIHIHLVQFEVIEREDATGARRGPEAWETGPKDTVISFPGEITRVKAQFDREGLFVWHCHILEHEDNEMMRPYRVGGSQTSMP